LGRLTARSLYREFGNNLDLIAENLGIRIVQALFEDSRVMLIRTDPNNRTLFYGPKTPQRRILYVLGYCILHPETRIKRIVTDAMTDIEANKFADEWLLLAVA
jgi:uncharacterized protein YjaZ